MLLPVVPEYLKNKPEFDNLVKTVKTYCSKNKEFILVHYGVCKKLCDDPNAKKSIKNILAVVDGTEEGNKRLDDSVKELKEVAERISEGCRTLIETPDATIRENIEKFCLYIEILTQQFV